MTKQQAIDLGYALKQASPYEVGLTKHGKGVRTWWLADFGGRMPKLDHQDVIRAIQIHEEFRHQYGVDDM
jgi:hypothetical protein